MNESDEIVGAGASDASGSGSLYHRDFNIHTLGWKAFQDFVATVLTESLGFPPAIFSSTGDAGRDAAFRTSGTPPFGLGGTYTVQVKFTSVKGRSLSLAGLKPEIKKAEALGRQGLARNYVVVTNCTVTAPAHAEIVNAFNAIPGIEFCDVLGVDWLDQQIAENKRLRAMVPRLYGLGDLSEILDERAYQQARQILASMGDDVAKLVITKAYRKSASALLDKGFVLLLGEPASGKSTIAAGLSLAANDLWGSRPLKLVSPADFVTHWNPNEDAQFFWFDDAFGSTQFQQDLVGEWNAILPHLSAAINKGSRLLLTSRTYIYYRAAQALKTSAFPLLRDSQVIIHVEDLSRREKSQILYNHIKLGTQPIDFKLAIRPHLPRIAQSKHFLPETARRLGNPLFTKDLRLSREALDSFISKPVSHLADVIEGLDVDSQCCLAIIYMRGGRLHSPVVFSHDEVAAVRRLGSTEAGTLRALEDLKGTLTRYIASETDPIWSFQHPTIRDAMAEYVAARPEYLDIYLSGTSAKQLINEIVCGVQLQGAKVNVPRARYGALISKLADVDRDQLHSFLATRCGRAFLSEALPITGPKLFSSLYPTNAVAPSRPIALLLQRLAEYDLLPEEHRKAYVECVDRQVSFGDFTALDESSELLLTPDDREILLDIIRAKFLDDIFTRIDKAGESWNDEEDQDPETVFREITTALETAEGLLAADPVYQKTISAARLEIEERIDSMREEWNPPPEPDYDDRSYDSMGESFEADAEMFSDVAE